MAVITTTTTTVPPQPGRAWEAAAVGLLVGVAVVVVGRVVVGRVVVGRAVVGRGVVGPLVTTPPSLGAHLHTHTDRQAYRQADM